MKKHKHSHSHIYKSHKDSSKHDAEKGIKTAFFLQKSLEVQQKAVPLQPQNGTIPFFFEMLVTNLRK